jgi:hypothetical protein
MNEAHADSSAAQRAGQKPENEGPAASEEQGEGGWSRQRWLTLVALVFAGQVGLIFVLGEKQFPPPRAMFPHGGIPHLTLADSSNELIALNDPTLFVLPHARDFASVVWDQMPVVPQPSFCWMEPPGDLPLAVENLGAIFTRFMQTNQFAAPALDFKPEPAWSAPVLPLLPVSAGNSTLHIEGELAQRRLLTPVDLPSLPYPDVIGPSKVQALVDAAGSVFSAVLLPPDNAMEVAGRPDVGDTNALQIARSLRFAPASRPTVGQLIFDWRTVVPPATNPPAAAP